MSQRNHRAESCKAGRSVKRPDRKRSASKMLHAIGMPGTIAKYPSCG